MPSSSDSFDRAESTRDVKERLHRLKLSMADEYDRLKGARSRWHATMGVMRSRALLALLVFVAVAAILYVVNPPLTQRARRNRFDIERQDPLRVVALSAAATLPVLLAPARLWRTRNNDAAHVPAPPPDRRRHHHSK